MDIQKTVNLVRDLSQSINKVNDIDTKLEYVELTSIITGVGHDHVMNLSFDEALNDFVEYVYKKQSYFKILENEMGEDFSLNNQPWAKINQYRRVESEVKMLNAVSAYIAEMDTILRREMMESIKNSYEVESEKEHYRQQAEYWHAQCVKAYESESFFTGLALRMTEKAVELKEKVQRYQTLFIQKLDLKNS